MQQQNMGFSTHVLPPYGRTGVMGYAAALPAAYAGDHNGAPNPFTTGIGAGGGAGGSFGAPSFDEASCSAPPATPQHHQVALHNEAQQQRLQPERPAVQPPCAAEEQGTQQQEGQERAGAHEAVAQRDDDAAFFNSPGYKNDFPAL
eukprot:CAMPEP_0173110616 /NCGR_PEP_ID=MMETSP1102-20130122/44483_1 /TAXON_ID=49646 /ORGANISM="Geminigera sp., Strain Caron Lab Isolate" /LENGTH=145 /DNA_ID=CAMNT_0014010439 /DNA_START=1 /DNA_END=438 /DNA_ORIENTATION=-